MYQTSFLSRTLTTFVSLIFMQQTLSQDIPVKEVQLSAGSYGHCLNSTQCFSPDGKWIVYDTRNIDSHLSSNGAVRMINVHTGEDVLLYQAQNQTEFGPGVGAVTFSPDGRYVLFLGGIQNASKDNPYSFTRRTGIAVNINDPLKPIWMDGRDIVPPFTPGALRGGTHAHTWSGDGKWISFTYNDHILSEKIKTDSSVIDTRTVGIMFPRAVTVANADDIENKNGSMYAILVTRVVKHPAPGSDEIAKAFDECWIGTNGYLKPDGTRQHRAIAFQGNIVDKDGHVKTEIFVADIPDSITTIKDEPQYAGTSSALPAVPSIIHQRRISFTEKGVSDVPRHWLRTTPDGSVIGFLAADDNGIIQLWSISPNGGTPRQMTNLSISISGPFNFSPDGNWVAFTAGTDVWITHTRDGKTLRVVGKAVGHGAINGAINWSTVDKALCYNRYVKEANGEFLQIFLAELPGGL